MNTQIEDLLTAAKLLAEREGNKLAAYLISMAMLEAQTSSKEAIKAPKAA